MEPKQIFRYCPRCGAECEPGSNPLRCQACDFHYYFNPTCATAAFIFDSEGRALFIKRAKDPAKGMLGLPGGFIDIGETAEEGLRREVREEVNLEIDGIAFLSSYPNSYLYRDVAYPVCDLIFTVKAVDATATQSLEGVDAHVWRMVKDVAAEELAFPSMQKSLELLKAR
jgi:ADP-ribose pyrophosphatase YjhB (NUDIX family)